MSSQKKDGSSETFDEKITRKRGSNEAGLIEYFKAKYQNFLMGANLPSQEIRRIFAEQDLSQNIAIEKLKEITGDMILEPNTRLEPKEFLNHNSSKENSQNLSK